MWEVLKLVYGSMVNAKLVEVLVVIVLAMPEQFLLAGRMKLLVLVASTKASLVVLIELVWVLLMVFKKQNERL